MSLCLCFLLVEGKNQRGHLNSRTCINSVLKDLEIPILELSILQVVKLFLTPYNQHKQTGK